MKLTSFSNVKLPIVLIALFSLLQLGVLVLFGYTPYHDSDSYLYLAEECVRYGEPYPVKHTLNDIPFLWNIGAINAVAASLALTDNIIPLLVIYSLMKGLTALSFYLLAKKILGQKTALICLLIYIAYPANYGEGTSTLTELPFMFFIMLGIWLIVARNYYFLGGLLFALANWFRPMGIVFLLATFIYLILCHHNKKQCFSRITFHSLRLIIGYIVMVCIIGFATMHRTGLFLYQSKTGWMALADYSTNHSSISMSVRDNNNWNVAQKDSAWQAIFLQWLVNNPCEYFKQMPRKLVDTYISDNVNMCVYVPNKTRETMYEVVSLRTLINCFPSLSPLQWFTVVNQMFYYLLLFTAFFSLRYFSIKKHLLPMVCIIIGTLLLLFFGHGEARFHQPFIPFIIMLSALFLQGILPNNWFPLKDTKRNKIGK